MAVSFNVPKSPKRDIFVVDNFQGVDFTNVGAEVDATRSPNAPNMIRHVPGKVRKRMGYEKYIQFSSKANVNFAKDTSSKESTIVFTLSSAGTAQKLYDLTERIASTDEEAFTVYLEFDYRATAPFTVIGVNVSASEDWTHFSGSKTFQPSEYIEWVEINSETQQNIDIRSFALLKARNSSYRWSPAPVYFVEDTTSNYVYGCHLYKTFENKGNRVVNVNRALGTSSSWKTIALTNEWQDIYTLGNYIWTDGTARTTMYIEFDYTLTGSNNAFVSFASYYSTSYKLTPTTSSKHMSYTQNCGSYTSDRSRAKLESGTSATLRIRNLSISYDRNDQYTWSKAPEDTGGTFPIEDVYFDGQNDYVEIDNYGLEWTTTSNRTTKYFPFLDILSPDYDEAVGFVHLSFDCYAFTTDNNLTSIYLGIDCGGTTTNPGINCASITETGNIINKHYDVYTCSDGVRSVNAIFIAFNFATEATRECSVNITNIKMYKITPRSIFNTNVNDKSYYLLHVGKRLYIKPEEGDGIELLNGSLALNRSWSAQLDDKLILLDGNNIYTYKFGQAGISTISQKGAYIPLVTIAKRPDGGGTSYEALNMLQPAFKEQFYVNSADANKTAFHLSFRGLDTTEVKAWKLNSSGNWASLKEGINFTVNRTTGVVTFTSAPGQSPLTGEDNVRIQAYRTVEGYRDRVSKCRFGALFGVGGASDRVFLSGNPNYPNQDFFSGQNDITYFPDTGYAKLGTASGAIVGYAKVNNYLATFKNEADKSQNVIIREGDLVTNNATHTSEPAFRIINALQGEGALSAFSFGYLQTEPLFLTESGILAITAQDITGEKYGQNRSFYVNEKLTAEPNLENASCTVFKDMYILAVNSHLYVLDGLQPVRTDKGEPYATRQYAAFYCTDIPATCIWNNGEELFFGTENGRICRFHTKVDELNSYNDDGKAIDAWWETPDLDGKLFYKNKTFRYLAIRMMQALRTSVTIYARRMSNWGDPIKEDRGSGVVFDFENIDFENFSFSTDTTEKVVHTKLRIKKVDKARFKIENKRLNEPFGLFDLALEYVESGNYKG